MLMIKKDKEKQTKNDLKAIVMIRVKRQLSQYALMAHVLYSTSYLLIAKQ